MHIFLIFFLLLAPQFTHAIEPRVHDAAKIVIKRYHVKKEKTIIALSNGTVWLYEDRGLFGKTNGWQVGDAIAIDYNHLSDSGYFLENLSYCGRIPIYLKRLSKKDGAFLTIKEITHHKEEGTKYSKTAKIVLSDDSIWHIGSWSRKWMKKWKRNHRVIVCPHVTAGNATHWMINLDCRDMLTLFSWSPLLPSDVRAQLLSPSIKSLPSVNFLKRPAYSWTLRIKDVRDANLVELENGTIWQCDTLDSWWRSGDEVTFDFDNKTVKICKRYSKSKARLANKGSDAIHTHTIQLIKKKKGKIILNNGSTFILPHFSAKHWKKGDHVIFSPSKDTYSSGCLINIDRLRSENHALLVR